MQDEAPNRYLQEDVITALCWSDKHGRAIADRVDPSLFASDYRIIAERAIGYWNKYDEAPKEHIPDLVADFLEDKRGRKVETYKRILSSMAMLAETINVTFVLDQLRDFERGQRLQLAILKSAELTNAGKREEAEEVLRRHVEHAPPSRSQLTTRSLDQFERREIGWLWKPFVPLGMVTLIFGDGGIGKSSVTIDMAARISKGELWPVFGDDRVKRARTGSVLIMSKEDDPSTIIRPRLEAAKADLRRVHMIGREMSGDPEQFDPIDRLDTAVSAVEDSVRRLGDVELVIIDPVTDFTGSLDIYRDDQVRALLSPLARLAAQHDLAVIIVIHLNKKQDVTARHRALGGVGFMNVPRSAIVVAEDKDDSSRKIMAQVKGNLTPARGWAVAFRMKTVGAYARIDWESDWFEQSVDDLLNAKKDPVSKREQASKLLRKLLAEGPIRPEDADRAAEREGIGQRTLREAKAAIGVESRKSKGVWWWFLRKGEDDSGFKGAEREVNNASVS